MRILFAIIIVACFVFSSCEKSVSFNLNQTEPKLVVEGTVENGRPPIVILSKSLGYFSSVDLQTLQNSFVHNADVFISTSGFTSKLREFSVPLGGGFTSYFYSVDASDPGYFQGTLDQQYNLRIVSEGKEYTASTRIPAVTKRIDSLYWKQAPVGNPPDKVMLIVKATDPPGYGDYIRYFTKQNSDPYYPGLTSVYDDQLIDGTSYEVQVERGVDRNETHPDGYSYFNKGDTVIFKLCNIDKGTFDFWRTMEYSYSSIGNPFSSPTRVISNISGNALGYFGGYAAQYRLFIFPK